MVARRSPPLPFASPSLLLLGTFAASLFLFNFATAGETDDLLVFKSTISDPTGALQSWAAGTKPCKKHEEVWNGVICDEGGEIYGLRLENMSLSGTLDFDALKSLDSLRTLSLMNNTFKGPIPEVGKLNGLRSLYLSVNQFSGTIPADTFSGMVWLKKLDLSENEFSGPIPKSLTSIPKLLELKLDNNKFQGAIPDFPQKELRVVDVANNDLQGPIPDSLSKMPSEYFAGNKGLCGGPLGTTCAVASDCDGSDGIPCKVSPISSRKSLSNKALIGIIIGVVLGVVMAAIGISLASAAPCKKESSKPSSSPSPSSSSSEHEKKKCKEEKLEEGAAAAAAAAGVQANDEGSVRSSTSSRAGRRQEPPKLMFLKDDRERFELTDLLKSSAEVLGTGSFGCTYKATLQNGLSMVVKRIKDMNRVGREDFEEHMRRLGRLAHPNLLPLVAYYYKKEEKLFVTDFAANGNLANQLHGKQDSSNRSLDWPARYKIIQGIARGLSYLYDELQMLTIPHGHLKSSNVVLDHNFEPLLTDYALLPVLNQPQAAHLMEAYKAPECKETGKTSKKSDLWSFGLLLLEILTGKSPANFKEGENLASWVEASGQAAQILDKDMKIDEQDKDQALKLLRVALACCKEDVDKRCDATLAFNKILGGNEEDDIPL